MRISGTLNKHIAGRRYELFNSELKNKSVEKPTLQINIIIYLLYHLYVYIVPAKRLTWKHKKYITVNEVW